MRALILIAALAVAFALPASAGPLPVPPPILSGTVRDTAGTPLSQARITVLELHRTTATGPEGRFVFAGLPAGTYTVSVALVGFAPQTRRVLLRGAGDSLDVTLRPTTVELPEVQVTASASGTTPLTSPQPTGVLSPQELRENRSASLGETVSALPGVRSLSTGSGIGKPVIRGLSSNRVLVLDDGHRIESQQWGDEHGPQVEAGEADRIEVIRGPASVLYGSDALGGVVNVIPKPIPDAIGHSAFVRGSSIASYSTNNRQPDGTVQLEGADGGLGARAAFTGRTSDDTHTPDGPLSNSGGSTVNGSGIVGYRGGWGSASLSYDHRDERVEIHEDPAEDPEATPFQRIGEDRLRGTADVPVGLSRVEATIGFERNRRREFEKSDATDVSLGLLSRTWNGDVRLRHAPVGPLHGIVGVSGIRNEFDKFGEESLIPDNAYNNAAVYAFEQLELGRWSFSFGGRYDYRRLSVADDATLGVTAQRRTYQSMTGNLGALYRVAEPVALVLNVGRGFRAPSAFDLFSNGVHEGTVRFERGDSTLTNETSLNTDLALRIQTSRFTTEVGMFANYIQDFIFADPSGEIDPGSGFQIYDVAQGNARLTGFEAAAEYHPTVWLHLRGAADYIRGQNTTLEKPLPLMPPFRVTYGARLEGSDVAGLDDPYVSVGGETNATQTQLDPNDVPTRGFSLANVGLGFILPLGVRRIGIDAQLRNALDRRYADFLSRYKAYALDPGRNLVVRVSTDF